MYPIIRVLKEALRAKRMPPLEALGAHVSYHRCWPHDLDVYMEMNNGRILSILDIGRTGLAQRVGLIGALKDNKWGMTMAGNSVRYRKRIRLFAKFRAVSRAVGWDDKFFYLEHSIWIGKDCAVQALFRAAVTDKNGIVSPAVVFAHVGHDGKSPEKPAWVHAWIDADNKRPWPPKFGQTLAELGSSGPIAQPVTSAAPSASL
jgi:acyl-CoA thioesterase FadM